MNTNIVLTTEAVQNISICIVRSWSQDATVIGFKAQPDADGQVQMLQNTFKCSH